VVAPLRQLPALDLFAAAQLAPPWYAVLGGNLAVACIAEAEQLAAAERRAKEAAAAAELAAKQVALVADVESPVALPRTVADCRGPGICPKFGCEFNVILQITVINDDMQTISVGGRGGGGNGASIAARRNAAGKVTMDDLDAVVDAALELCDALPSTCMLDYIEDPSLLPTRDSDEEGTEANARGNHMTLDQIAAVFGITREGARRAEQRALAKGKAAPDAEELAPDFVPAERLVRR
jgi:hypothetical protein